ncbi:MAG: hypothetical protein ABI193_22015 [Minicystis sp.]
MGMDWLKGLVGSSDQMVPAGQAVPGSPAWGQQPYGAPQGGYAPPGAASAPQGGPPLGGMPAPTSGPQMGGTPYTPPWGAQPVAQTAPMQGGGDARVAALEARCAELRKDVDAIALFARTLLTMLEEKQVVTPELFQATKAKLDLLDGKMDDRIG